MGVVVAPAGYGKTTLLVDAITSLDERAYWLSIDEWDKDATTLVEYLCLAVGASCEGLECDSQEARIRSLGRAVTALAAADAILVIDDVHLLPAESDLAGIVDYLARQLPQRTRLFLSARTRPALPSLPRLRIQGQVVEIGSADLAFTEEEVLTYSERASGRVLSAAEAKAILESTGGWPTAVALKAAQDRSSADDQLDEYLFAEVISKLPSDVQEFMKKTSVLPVLTASLCNAVTRRSDARQLLDIVERAQLPLLRLRRGELRLHALVRDHLLETLREDAGNYKENQRRAGLALREAGRLDEAIQHFAAAEDWPAACRLIVDEAPRAYLDGRWHAIMTWLQAVPRADREADVEVSLWEARVLVRFGGSDEALRVIERLVRLGTLSEAMMAEAESLRAAALRVKGDPEAAIVSGRLAVELAFKSNASLNIIAEAKKQFGIALFTSGKYEAAIQEMRSALEIFERRGEDEEAATLNGCVGSAMASLGQVDEAISHLEHSREQWRRIGNTKELSWTLNNLAMAYILGGQLTTARELLVEAVAITREAEFMRMEAYAVTSMADLDRLSGDAASARRGYRRALALTAEVGEPALRAIALSGLARVEASSGDPIQAEALAREALADARERRSGFEEALARIALGAIFKQRGDADRACDELASADALLGTLGPSREHIEDLVLLAESLLPLRRRRSQLVAVLERLATVVESAGAESYLALLAREHLSSLQYAASRRVAGPFYKTLLRKAQTKPTGLEARAEGLPFVDIKSFGGFSVSVDGRPVLDVEWESGKAKELLLLLLTTEAPLSRDEIIAQIWPESGGRKASAVFHSSLYRLRHAVYQTAVVQDGGRYSLSPSGTFHFDVQRFRRLVESRSRPEERVEELGAAVNLYHGQFAPDFDSEWVEEVRGELDRLFAEAAGRLVDELLLRGQHSEAISVCQILLERDAYDEDACKTLLQAALESGDARAGLRAYERLTDALVVDLGERPGDDLARLAADLRAQLPSPP